MIDTEDAVSLVMLADYLLRLVEQHVSGGNMRAAARSRVAPHARDHSGREMRMAKKKRRNPPFWQSGQSAQTDIHDHGATVGRTHPLLRGLRLCGRGLAAIQTFMTGLLETGAARWTKQMHSEHLEASYSTDVYQRLAWDKLSARRDDIPRQNHPTLYTE